MMLVGVQEHRSRPMCPLVVESVITLCFCVCSYEVQGCEVIWAIKNKAIGNTFFDAGAAQFLIPTLEVEKPENALPCKRARYTTNKATKPKAGASKSAYVGCLVSTVGKNLIIS